MNFEEASQITRQNQIARTKAHEAVISTLHRIAAYNKMPEEDIDVLRNEFVQGCDAAMRCASAQLLSLYCSIGTTDPEAFAQGLIRFATSERPERPK